MAQEFTIKSEEIESKINQLLPSQGGFGAGVDFSASTMVIPIVDLTETAEGSSLRQDLQTSLSLKSVTAFSESGSSATIINTTGYFRIYGRSNFLRFAGSGVIFINITDGTTTKTIYEVDTPSATASTNLLVDTFDFVVLLQAGDSIIAGSTSAQATINGVTRQLADTSGNLVNP